MIISLDTECTGLDLYHRARPFFVTVCFGGEQKCWMWDVDPLTREVDPLSEDVEEIQNLVDEADEIVFQNSKYDICALSMIGIEVDWKKVQDTLVAGHILASKLPHDLTSMGIQYLGHDISSYEEKLRKVVLECRRYVTRAYPEWKIAKKHGEDTPSAKDELWRNDYWLPMAVAKEEPDNHLSDSDYLTVLEEYGNADSDLTFHLWPVMKQELHHRGYWQVYLDKMKVLPVAFRMEQRGVTYSVSTLERKKKEYIAESEQAGRVCVGIAKEYDYDLELPKSGRNKSLNGFVFDVLKLPVVKATDTGNPSFDAEVKEQYELTLPRNTLSHLFIKNLNKKASLDTAVSYMIGYERYGICLGEDMAVLHSNINVVGTAHTRWSLSNPNNQNISKQSEHNLREVFGPAPGREWWSPDADNIELRLSAYAAREEELIKVFERPDDAPYFGSYHLVVFDILHPDLFKKHGAEVKSLLADKQYGQVKNGNFAIQYGAQEKKADLTYGVPGAFQKIRGRFPRIAKLNDEKIREAEKTGLVVTMQGYPVMCSRSEWGKIIPTTPFNYFISGSAGIWMQSALVRCDEQLQKWREKEGFDGHIIMNVHDEIVFDFPKGTVMEINLPKMRTLQKLMEKGGDDVGIPTPVSLEYNPENWAKGVKVCRVITAVPASIGKGSRDNATVGV